MWDIINVTVVQHQPILREGLIKVLSQSDGMRCTGFASIGQINETPAVSSNREIFLIDFGQDSGMISQGVASLKKRFPNAAIVVLAERYCHSNMLISLESGARGYLLNHISCEVLTKALELLALGENIYLAQAGPQHWGNGRLEAHEGPSNLFLSALSLREFEVLTCLTQGKSNKLIARKWGISEGTVKVHVKAILRKTKLNNRTEVALWARDHGIDAYSSTGDLGMPSSSNGLAGS